MTEHRDPDGLIAAYFAQPAPDLPDRAFDAVRRDIHRTPQRRVLWPWRAPERRALGRGLPVAAAVLLILSLWLLSLPGLGPGGTPTSSPAPPPNLFRSPLYGYSVVIPNGWTATPAAVRWDGETQPSIGSNVDQIAGPHLVVLGYAGAFTGDLAAFVQDRMAATARDHADTCPPNALELNESITMGGQAGVLLGLNCGARIDQAITVHDGIGYAFTIRDLAFATTLDPTDLASVRSMLASLIFPSAPIESP
jgi:hypothetical protein